MAKKRNIVEVFDRGGTHVEIEVSCGRSGPVFSAHYYRSARGYNGTLAPFYSLEAARSAVQHSIDQGEI